MYSDFAEAWDDACHAAHETAKSKGWWEEDRSDGELIALMHSELSEALEALRKGKDQDSHLPFFLGVEVELADVVIRIMDYCAARQLRVGDAIIAKMAYNAQRSYRHGNKAF